MTMNLILFILQAIAAVVLPVGAVVFVKNKFAAKIRNAFDGMAVFLIFYCLIYAVVSTCVELLTPLYSKVESEIWLIIINALVETLCVFMGYHFWFKVAIKTKDNNGVGLMTGVGFAFTRTIFAYGISAVLGVVTGLMYNAGKLTEVPEILQSSLDGFLYSTPEYIFFLLLQLISIFALETAVAFVIYRVKMCEDAGYWILAAFVLRVAAITILKCGLYLDRIVIVFIVIAIALMLCGLGYSLAKPFVRKKEEA